MKSILRKLRRSDTFYVNELDDIVGFRVIFESFADLQSAIKAFESQGIRLKNYLEEEHPVGTGYRGVHAFLVLDQDFDGHRSFKVRFEVQLRTYYQHLWACWSEGMDEYANINEHAKEGWPNRRHEPEIQAKVEKLQRTSLALRAWEEANPNHIQPRPRERFPLIENLSQRFAVVRGNADGYIGLDDCDDSEEAFDVLAYYENLHGLETLLLFGLPKAEVNRHFSETHLNWFHRVPDPEYWLPKA